MAPKVDGTERGFQQLGVEGAYSLSNINYMRAFTGTTTEFSLRRGAFDGSNSRASCLAKLSGERKVSVPTQRLFSCMMSLVKSQLATLASPLATLASPLAKYSLLPAILCFQQDDARVLQGAGFF